MKKQIVPLILSFLLSACTISQDNVIRDRVNFFAFENKSGVKVAIVPKGVYSNLPDSLVLEDGESCFWGVDGPTPIQEWSSPLAVYFNETVILYYNDNFGSDFKDPRNWVNYTEKSLHEDKYEADTYTFTVEDYQRAVEQNKK